MDTKGKKRASVLLKFCTRKYWEWISRRKKNNPFGCFQLTGVKQLVMVSHLFTLQWNSPVNFSDTGDVHKWTIKRLLRRGINCTSPCSPGRCAAPWCLCLPLAMERCTSEPPGKKLHPHNHPRDGPTNKEIYIWGLISSHWKGFFQTEKYASV